MLAVEHASHCKELTDQEHALTAETGEYKLFFFILFGLLVFLNTERIVRNHILFEPLHSLDRAETPVGGAGGKNSIRQKPLPCI